MIVDVDEDVAALERWIKEQGRFGSIAVLDVAMSFDGDWQGERALFVDLTLSDPAPGEDSWPIEDVLAMHHVIDEKAGGLRSIERWYVRLQPLTDDTAGDDEDDETDWPL
jgi:hypothetical protein